MEDIWKYSKKELIMVGVVIVFILIIGLILFNSNSNQDIKIEEEIDQLVLFGEREITLEEGDKYVEPGFYAITNQHEIKQEEVNVTPKEIDTTKPGTYQITYTIGDKVEKRKIIIKEKEQKDETEEKEELTLTLKGDSTVVISVGTAYIEPGYNAQDLKDGDITEKVKVSGQVDTGKAGTYTITYEIENSSLKKISKTRTIIVRDEVISANITGNPTSYTNKNIELKIEVSGENFYYIKYPNGSVNRNKKATYTIVSNGKYKFLIYDKNNNYIVKEVVVDKIDKIKPKGSCKADVLNGKTTITIGATDENSGIKNYIIKSNGKELKNQTSNKYVYNKELTSANVVIYDNALNNINVSCVIKNNNPVKTPTPQKSDSDNDDDEDESHDATKPPSGYTEKYSASSSSLKIKIVSKDGIYYSYIWAKNPVKQFNKQMVTSNSLQSPLSILQEAVKKQSLSNKIVLGFNASSMVDGVKYGKDLVKKDSRYNYKEQLPLLIYNGKVVINDYQNYPVNQVIYYMDGNSKLKYIPKLGDYSSSERKKIFEDVINSGARNTIHFRPVLIYNGKAVTLDSKFKNMDADRKQALCQIDTNNFILATSSSSGKITYPNFVKKLLNLGCKTAFEFDGGGSTSLFFKKSSQSSFTKLTSGRNNSTMMFFTEL